MKLRERRRDDELGGVYGIKKGLGKYDVIGKKRRLRSDGELDREIVGREENKKKRQYNLPSMSHCEWFRPRMMGRGNVREGSMEPG